MVTKFIVMKGAHDLRFLQEDRGDDLPRRHSTFDASIRSWGINE